jgi:hypothetical protein
MPGLQIRAKGAEESLVIRMTCEIEIALDDVENENIEVEIKEFENIEVVRHDEESEETDPY